MGSKSKPHRSTIWRRNNPTKVAANRKRWKDDGRALSRQLKYMYGITLTQYEAMRAAQKGVCPICALAGMTQDPTETLCVDHDHKTNAIRALICRRHNFLLGLAHDNLAELSAAYYYLKHYQGGSLG